MKRLLNWQVVMGLGLIVLSSVLYLLHFTLFRDAHHIFIYLLGDIAFVPIEVLFVTLIIHRLLTVREKRTMLKKMNMVIGAFFSEVGTELLRMFSDFEGVSDNIKDELIIQQDWSSRQFLELKDKVANYEYNIKSEKEKLKNLKTVLTSKRGFLLHLLENPNLLEHDAFTNLLWAVFHLTEELEKRENIKKLPERDLEHLSGDICRVYVLLFAEWVDYMQHLKNDYPYLFSLAIRTNPFDPNSMAEIR